MSNALARSTNIQRLTLLLLVVPAAGALNGGSVAAAATAPLSAPNAGQAVQPNAANNLDCNGWSATYSPIRPTMRELCTDPIDIFHGHSARPSRFEDNGHYVGHDEPSVRFLSTSANSANTMTYFMQLPSDGSAIDYAQLSPAPWFGIALCDPSSAPFGSCTPDSDSNSSSAGSAVMELQFYPPRFGPFVDGPSCDASSWCAAINIDSLECNSSGCNKSCTEPVNFAYLTLDGIPTGPPSPQRATVQTMVPNSDTLFMGSGDTLRVSIFEAYSALETRVDDLTNGQSGYMIANATNGFMDTSLSDCSGSPFNFHGEFNTAAQSHVVPWASLEIGVVAQQEIGHFETCSSLTNAETASGSGWSDSNAFETCVGGSDGGTTTPGEGPCSNGTCSNSTTEGGGPCTKADNGLCEFADAHCFPSGNRSVTINGSSQTWSWPVNGCEANQFQNGDLDFDGDSYRAEWPDGGSTHPTSIKYLGPFDAAGNLYPMTQFQTDVPGSESMCNTSDGSGCQAPPSGAAFYPFWSVETSRQLPGITPSVAFPCVWNFGNDISGVTSDDFSKDAQYGSPDLAHYGGNLISSTRQNPATHAGTAACPTITAAQVIPPPPPGAYTPTTPFRVFDSRSSDCHQCFNGGAPIGPEASHNIRITGHPSGSDGTVPTNASAVAVDLVGTQGTAKTFTQLTPMGSGSVGATSTSNLPPNTDVANLDIVPVGAQGEITLYNYAGSTHAAIDVAGWFTPVMPPPAAGTSGTFHPLAPLRVCDSRANMGTACDTSTSADNPLQQGESRVIRVTGLGIPSTGTPAPAAHDIAVAMNITLTGETASTFVTAYPATDVGGGASTCGSVPNASNVNAPSGVSRPNRSIVPIDVNGDICLFNHAGTTNFIVDVNGWFGDGSESNFPGALYYSAPPVRICDTRADQASNQCNTGGNGTIAQMSTLSNINASGNAAEGAPANPVAVVINVTGTRGTADTYLTIYPAGSTKPATSDLNVPPQTDFAVLDIVQLGVAGDVNAYNNFGSIDLILDAQGWFA